MLFNSFEFIFVFLPLVLITFYAIPFPRFRVLFLTLASYVFYGFWNYKFCTLLLASTAIDYWVGLSLAAATSSQTRKHLLLLSLVTNLSILGFFKYFNFIAESATSTLSLFFTMNAPPHFDIVLPVGISFYTFQSMSYTIDLYRKSSQPYRDFAAFAAYVSLFPQLVAGPIVRHDQLVPQIATIGQTRFNAENFSRGIFFFVVGLAKKILIADRIGVAIDPALATLSSLNAMEAWLCLLGYTLQLYFDFSGYSDMAVGLGKMLNLNLPQNFNSPYKSASITEFWQRWHMTLGNWLRDYLYISLGGNRRGKYRTYINLAATMVLGGLWHGAGWTFVLWGAFHGTFLAWERARKRPLRTGWRKVPYIISTFFLVQMGWVLFRSTDLAMAAQWYKTLFTGDWTWRLSAFAPNVRDLFVAAMLIGVPLVFFGRNTFDLERGIRFSIPQAGYLAAALVACLIFFTRNSPFLYFQF